MDAPEIRLRVELRMYIRRQSINIPLWNPLTGKMGENLNGLSVAQHDETAVGLAVSDLLDATRVVGRLASSSTVSMKH